jgi:Tfp pilus assembly protein PilF
VDADFLNAGALDQAHQFARRAVEIDPNLPEAHHSVGFALMARHELDASIAAFERANALNPNSLTGNLATPWWAQETLVGQSMS